MFDMATGISFEIDILSGDETLLEELFENTGRGHEPTFTMGNWDPMDRARRNLVEPR